MKKQLFIALCLPFLLGGCGSNNSEADELLITLNATSITISEEKTYQLEATTSKAIGGEIAWSVKDESVASVSSTGLVTAVLSGTTQVYAKFEDAVAVCSVKVTPFEPDAALSIEMEQTSFALYVGDEFTLPMSVHYGDETITDYTASYTVENSGIASIADGKITAKSLGETTAVITVTYLEESAEQLISIAVL